MTWPMIVGLVVGIPIVLLPIAFVWYLNVSGIYQVLRTTRARQRRRVAGAAGFRVAEKV